MTAPRPSIQLRRVRPSPPKVVQRAQPGPFLKTALATMKMTVTSYCLSGRTYTGSRVAPGTVAVDPSVVPLHSVLYIPGYGEARALDTGSAIKGNRLDVWYRSCQRSTDWGVRHIAVRILSAPRTLFSQRPELIASPVEP